MNEYAADYVEMQASSETRRAYRRDLQKWFDFAGVEERSVELAGRFKRHLEETLSPNSAARTWSTVRGFFKYLYGRRGWANMTPFDIVKAPKRPTGVTPVVPTNEDVELVLSEARKEVRRHIVVALLLNGLRAGEVTRMRVADVEKHNVDSGVAFMLRVHGKGNKQRLVPANYETLSAIGRHEGDSEWLAHDYDGDRLTVRQVEHDVYKCAEYAGVEGMHPHALRHHYATRLIRAGAGWGHVQQLLGHADVSTTMVYVTLDIKDLCKAARLDPMDERGIQRLKETLAS